MRNPAEILCFTILYNLLRCKKSASHSCSHSSKQLLLPCLAGHNRMYLQTLWPNKSFLPWVTCFQVFDHSDRINKRLIILLKVKQLVIVEIKIQVVSYVFHSFHLCVQEIPSSLMKFFCFIIIKIFHEDVLEKIS